MPDHATLYGHILILLTQIVTFVYSWLREGRRHQWEVEQRAAMAAIHTDIKNGHA